MRGWLEVTRASGSGTSGIGTRDKARDSHRVDIVRGFKDDRDRQWREQSKPWELAAVEKNEQGAVVHRIDTSGPRSFLPTGIPPRGFRTGRWPKDRGGLTELGTNEGIAVRIKKKIGFELGKTLASVEK